LVKAPYLPVETEKPYTLVLDLDETLIHYEDQKDVSLDDPG
jgi:predicted HAD superfamily phosphohydrolase YqeG